MLQQLIDFTRPLSRQARGQFTLTARMLDFDADKQMLPDGDTPVLYPIVKNSLLVGVLEYPQGNPDPTDSDNCETTVMSVITATNASALMASNGHSALVIGQVLIWWCC